MTKEINPKTLNQAGVNQLILALESTNADVWYKDIPITSNILGFENFSLTHTVFKRNREKTGYRFHVCSNKLFDSGGFGKLYKTKTLRPELTDDEVNLKKRHDRLVKIESKNKINSHEYQMAHRSNKLKIKPPTFFKINQSKFESYLVMKKIEGKSLQDILLEDCNGQNPLSLEQRIELSKAILKAINLQCTNFGFVHRDIKPGNIMVNLETMEVTVLDYGLSLDPTIPDYELVGSKGFAPYEAYTIGIYSDKSDVYSASRIIALIMGDSVFNFQFTDTSIAAAFSVKVVLRDLFSKLSIQQQNQFTPISMAYLKLILRHMSSIEPSERPPITEVLRKFELLKPNHLNKLDVTIPDHLNDAEAAFLNNIRTLLQNMQTHPDKVSTNVVIPRLSKIYALTVLLNKSNALPKKHYLNKCEILIELSKAIMSNYPEFQDQFYLLNFNFNKIKKAVNNIAEPPPIEHVAQRLSNAP